MSVKIRLTRMGDRKSPFYRVVVADSRSPRDGKFIEVLGTYDPLKTPAVIKIDNAKAAKWMADGAQPTDTAKSLLITAGVIPAPKQRPPAKLSYKKAVEPAAEVKPETKKDKTEVKTSEPAAEAVEPAAEIAESVEAVKTEAVSEEKSEA